MLSYSHLRIDYISFSAIIYGLPRATKKKKGTGLRGEMLKLIEKHIISNHHSHYQFLDKLCFLSKNLFNAVNYIVRQEFIFNQNYLNSAQTYHLIKDSVDYKAIPSKVSCQIIRLVDRCWSSFFASIKDYSKKPHKYLGKPNLPRYKHNLKGRCVTI